MEYHTVNPSLVPLAIIVGIPVLILIWFAATYNRLVNLRNTISESWSDVDTELKRRYDLIPNLVETVKGYAAHERALFEAVAEARARAMASQGDPHTQSQDENALVQTLRQLFAVSEGYPQLKADRNFLQLQEELVNTEDRIQAARRFFNGNVREYNTLAQSFPSNIVAGWFGFGSKDFFEIESLEARKPFTVTFGQHT